MCDLFGTRWLRRWFRVAPGLEDLHLVIAVRVEDLGVRLQEQRDGVRPRLHVRLGIVNGDGYSQVAEVGSLPAFGHMQGVAIRVRHVGAEPTAVAESDTLDNEGVALPLANGVSQPGGFGLTQLWQRPTIGEDLAERVP